MIVKCPPNINILLNSTYKLSTISSTIPQNFLSNKVVKKFGAGENFLHGFGCSKKYTSLKRKIPITVKVKEFLRITSQNFGQYFGKF